MMEKVPAGFGGSLRWVLTYRGGEGMWSWFFHRLTGVAILLFLLIHILDTALVGWPRIYNLVMDIYRHPVFHVGEVFLVAAVLFHALNGIRITLLDFFQGLMKYQRQLFYAELYVFLLLILPTAIWMLRELWR